MIKEVKVDTPRLIILIIVLISCVLIASLFVNGQSTQNTENSIEILQNKDIETVNEKNIKENQHEAKQILQQETEEKSVLQIEKLKELNKNEENIYASLDEVIKLPIEEKRKESILIPLTDIIEEDIISENVLENNNPKNTEKFENTITSIQNIEKTNNFEQKNEIILNQTRLFILYNKGKKVIETILLVNEKDPSISIAESSNMYKDRWEKQLTVTSLEHYNHELTTYISIAEIPNSTITVYWENENLEHPFETIDTEGNGLIDKLSFTIPHLSSQTFTIIISFSNEEILNMTNLSLTVFQAPNGVITNQSLTLSYNFSVAYYNLSLILCDFNLKNNNSIIVQSNVSFTPQSFSGITQPLTNGAYSWYLGCYDYTNNSINTSISNNFSIGLNYAPLISFTTNTTSINQGGSVQFNINVSMIKPGQIGYVLYYGDSTQPYSNIIFSNNLSQQLIHTYSQSGNIIATLNITINIEGIEYKQTLTRSITVTSTGDTTAPDITLLEPLHNEVLSDEQIDFIYKVVDQSPITNCTYNLYYYNTSSVGELIYDEVKTSVANNTDIKVSLVDFDEGEYTWEVECYDNATNHASKSKDFLYDIGNEIITNDEDNIITLSTESGVEIDDVALLLTTIDEFLINSGKYDQKEKEVVEDLDLINNLVFYKKKLTQIKIDLSHNLDFIIDEARRKERLNEILTEIENMREQVPTLITVENSEEFVKNSIDSDISDIVNAYLKANLLLLDSKGIRSFTNEIEKLQNEISNTVNIKHVTINYIDNTEKITLITKKPVIKTKNNNELIEVIPKEVTNNIKDITILTKHKVIDQEGIISIQYDDIVNMKIIYWISNHIDFDKIKKGDLLLIPKKNTEGFSAISAFSVFLPGTTPNSLFIFLGWILLIIFILTGVVFTIYHARIHTIYAKPTPKAILTQIRQSTQAITTGDLLHAESIYKHISELYNQLQPLEKKALYKKIQFLQISIDKKQAKTLLTECITALQQGRKDDATNLYQNLQLYYKKLPIQYQQKIIAEITPYLYLFKR